MSSCILFLSGVATPEVIPVLPDPETGQFFRRMIPGSGGSAFARYIWWQMRRSPHPPKLIRFLPALRRVLRYSDGERGPVQVNHLISAVMEGDGNAHIMGSLITGIGNRCVQLPAGKSAVAGSPDWSIKSTGTFGVVAAVNIPVCLVVEPP